MLKKRKGKLTLFGREVKKAIIDKGLSLSELAEELGMDVRYLSDILYGRRSGAKYLEKIALKLEIDLKKYIA